MSFKSRYEKRVKKADRYRRKLYYRSRNFVRSLGLGEIYFYERYDGIVFSFRSDLGTEIKDKDKIKNIINSNIEIKNFDTGKWYDNFEEYRKELLILKWWVK